MTDETREGLLAALNELLEAERAGARVTLETAHALSEPDLKALVMDVHRDEAKWCAMLIGAIKRMDGEPSETTGDFYGKVMAIEAMPARLALLNRGQGWVARRLRELAPTVSEPRLRADLDEMLVSHERNIGLVADRVPEAAPPARKA
ncbi:MAG: DUF6306 domain-containing protein [Caulobacteraceae bacterium]